MQQEHTSTLQLQLANSAKVYQHCIVIGISMKEFKCQPSFVCLSYKTLMLRAWKNG